ncbi:hypothetical protein, variant [Fonticula alba]|nr:hypothetical protein, variant [Fonticula alba]KCV67876.1 hypothetical protein, variant [Fonticula alba]|eukprot:XP_009497696.1 hypothetical protein, variant [Fonticula alba]
MACRSRDRASAARDEVIAQNPDAQVEIGIVDVSSPASVFTFCKWFLSHYNRLDGLFANAGIFPNTGIAYGVLPRALLRGIPYLMMSGGEDLVIQPVGRVTKDGLGEVFAANVFGHFIMVQEFAHLLQANNGRVVWTSSSTGMADKFSWSDPQCIKGNAPYQSSKYGEALLSVALNERLARSYGAPGVGTVRSICAMPGFVHSPMVSVFMPSWLWQVAIIFMVLARFISPVANITPAHGCEAHVYSALAPIGDFTADDEELISCTAFSPDSHRHLLTGAGGRGYVDRSRVHVARPAGVSTGSGLVPAQDRVVLTKEAQNYFRYLVDLADDFRQKNGLTPIGDSTIPQPANAIEL